MTERKICPLCNQRPRAINYIRNGKHYYRSVCDVCNRAGRRIKQRAPAWHLAGYRKKPQCERCGFKFKWPEQSGVFYIDGNLKNNNWANLKTVCLNCQHDVIKSRLGWRQGPLVPDF